MVRDEKAAVGANQIIARGAKPGDGTIGWVSAQDSESVAARLASVWPGDYLRMEAFGLERKSKNIAHGRPPVG
jgi:hypothetical protein